MKQLFHKILANNRTDQEYQKPPGNQHLKNQLGGQSKCKEV